jgi:hypothetical protein
LSRQFINSAQERNSDWANVIEASIKEKRFFAQAPAPTNDAGGYGASWLGSTDAPHADDAWNFGSVCGFQWFRRKDLYAFIWLARPAPPAMKSR